MGERRDVLADRCSIGRESDAGRRKTSLPTFTPELIAFTDSLADLATCDPLAFFVVHVDHQLMVS